MPPKVVLIRHAQGYHNVDNKSRLPPALSLSLSTKGVANPLPQDYSLPDPKLTPLGESQCLTLRDSLRQRFDSIPAQDIAVVVSPMMRTMQTAILALDWLAAKGVVFEASADWQENSSNPCDVGTPRAQLPPWPQVSFERLDPIWPDKTSAAAARYAHSRSAVVERGRLCLEDLYKRPEKLVLVVSHSGFLRVGCVGWGFFNSDYRIFEFEEGIGRDGRRVVRQDESTEKGGLGLSPTARVPLGDELPELPN